MHPESDFRIDAKILLNAAACQGCSFYCFWVIMGKPTEGGGGVKLTLPLSPQDKMVNIHTYEKYNLKKISGQHFFHQEYFLFKTKR